MLLLWRIVAPLQVCCAAITRVRQLAASVTQVQRLLSVPAEHDPYSPPVRIAGLQGHIAFHRVWLRYTPEAEPALLGVSLEVQPGEILAIRGSDGSGKTTLIKSLLGMYLPQSGSIRLDGVDIRQFDPLSLRQQIAYAPQAADFFPGTVRDNLLFAHPTASEEDCARALEEACALDEVMHLPKKLDTIIAGARAESIPFLLRQRLNLARTYVKPARIVLFDEGSYSLGPENDDAFAWKIARLRGSSTVLLITHREDHMRQADRLLVLEKGEATHLGPPRPGAGRTVEESMKAESPKQAAGTGDRRSNVIQLGSWLTQSEERLPKHLTRSIALEESPLPHIVRFGVAVIAGLLAVFLLWAANTRIEEIAFTTGHVIPSSHVQTIQHLEGGIVKSILVREGDRVEKGQPLLKLDDTSAAADLAQMRVRERALALHAERLRRFTSTPTRKRIKLDEDEAAILKSMEEARENQRRVLNDQLAQKRQELKRLTDVRDSLQKNVALVEKENWIRQEVARRGFGSQLTALISEREFNQIKGQLTEASGQVQQAEDAIREAQNRLNSLDSDLQQESMKTLGQVEAELAQVRENLEKLEGTARRTTITAPMQGVVKGLAVRTLGAVVEPGKLLLEIVPVDSELMVEATVKPSDVGHLQPRQKVNVKVSAYDFSRYGSVSGTLENISATTFPTQDGQAFYRAWVKLDQVYVGDNPARNPILPGMTVEADIITGNRTVMRYLLRPIYVAADTAFREH